MPKFTNNYADERMPQLGTCKFNNGFHGKSSMATQLKLFEFWICILFGS